MTPDDWPVAVRTAGFTQGLIGVERAQQTRARAALDRALAGGAVTNTRQGVGVSNVRMDAPSPQVFVTHPRAVAAIEATELGIDTASPRLPGRTPPTAWDGEPGWGSPAAVEGRA